MKKIIVNIITISLVLLTTVGFSAWYIIYQIVLNPEKSIGSISKYYELVQEVVYNGQEQVPITKQGVQLDFDPATLTYSYKLPNEKNYTNGKPVNANVYDVLISTTDGRACKIKFTIKPIEVRIENTELELNYVQNDYRKWDAMQAKLKTLIKFVDLTNKPVVVPFSVDSMTNGDKTYSRTSLSTANIYGSTYNVYISLPNNNYKIIGNNYVQLKYQTVKVGTKFYTIEDALNTPSGDIIMIGDASSTTSYVVTSFSKILGTNTYDLNNKKIILPYDGELSHTIQFEGTPTTLKDVYSALYIPSGITLNLNENTNLIVGGVVQQVGKVLRRSVLMNDGLINVNYGSKLLSYGFTKGKGMIQVNPNGEVLDVFRLFDWDGGQASLDLKNASVFPVNEWIVQNISCTTKIYYEGRYNSLTFIRTGGKDFTIENIYVVGDASTPNCLFKPNIGASKNDHIVKYCFIDNDNFNVDNQIYEYKNKIEIFGKYTDSTIKLKVTVKILVEIEVSFETSTSIAVPITNFDFILKPGSTLTFAKASYIFNKNSDIIIEKDATLLINGSAYVFTLNNCKITVDGRLGGSGYVSTVDTKNQKPKGNPINTNISGGIIDITNFNIPECKMKNTSTTAITMTGNTEGYIQQVGNIGLLTNGNAYVSMDFSNNFVFVSQSSVNKYYVDLHINESKEELVYSSVLPSMTITTNDLSNPKVIHYDFIGWYSDSTFTTQFNSHTFSTNNERISIYAKLKPKIYEFTYSAGFDNGTNVESISPNFTNQNPSFTIEDLEKGPIKITTTVTYQDKFFDGWYIGVNKTDVPYPFMEFNKVILEDYLNKAGIDNKIIPLYCEFSSNIIYEIHFITNKESAKIPDITSNTDTVDLTVQSNELNVDDLNLDSKVYFGGWYCDSEYKTKFINNETKLSAFADKDNRVNVYAKWEIKNIVTIKHRSIGTNVTTEKYAISGQSIDLTTCKYNDPYLYFANAYDASGSKLSNNTQEINSAVTFELEYAVDVIITTTGKASFSFTNGSQTLYKDVNYKIILESTINISTSGYRTGTATIKWCGKQSVHERGPLTGNINQNCPITYTVPTTQ